MEPCVVQKPHAVYQACFNLHLHITTFLIAVWYYRNTYLKGSYLGILWESILLA